MPTNISQLEALIVPIVEGLTYELWGVEFLQGGKASKLCLYIDSDSGINIEDCAQVSRQVSALLDVEDPIPGEYTLEVSSPGLDRRLFKKPQFERYVGGFLIVKTLVPINKRRKFSGKLVSVSGASLVLDAGPEGVVEIPFHQVSKANLVHGVEAL